MGNYNLFVYGSLIEGFFNYDKYLKGKVISNTPAVIHNMELYHLPHKGYPAILVGKEDVYGEIIEVRNYEDTVKAIDDMENFISEENPANEYHKRLLEVEHLESGKKEMCYVYFYNKDIDTIFDTEAIHIPEGSWKDFMNNR